MIIYSTCCDCGGLLHVTEANQCAHPLCRPRRTKVQRLAEEWLAAVTSGDEAAERELQRQIDRIDTAAPRLRDAALAYAAWGWPVFPLRAGEKRPATRRGFKDATTDMERIGAWWSRYPDHNIGLPTGLVFDVIDIDVPAGVPSWMRMLDDGDVPDVHGQVATASGGMHLYIPATGDGNRAGLLPGVDYRGAGGYVVAPPSRLGSPVRAWSWMTSPSPVITTDALEGVA